MSIASSEELDAVFGLESEGDTPEERSLTSKREFVRSQHQISIRQPDAPGRWFRANEILRLFGWETLRVLAARPASPVLRRGADPVSDLRKQIDALGVSEGGVLSRANVSEVGKRALKSKSQVPFADLEKLAQHLSLDSDLLGLGSEQPEVSRLSVRLRTIGSGPRALSEASVLALAEAAWVIGRQHALQNMPITARRSNACHNAKDVTASVVFHLNQTETAEVVGGAVKADGGQALQVAIDTLTGQWHRVLDFTTELGTAYTTLQVTVSIEHTTDVVSEVIQLTAGVETVERTNQHFTITAGIQRQVAYFVHQPELITAVGSNHTHSNSF